MAQNFVIRFSPETEVHEYSDISPDGKSLIPKSRPLCEVEKGILESVFKIMANTHKDIEEVNLCLDVVEQIRNAKDKVILDTKDVSNLKKGFEESAGKRPGSWFDCVDFMKQIQNPEKVDVEVKDEA